MIIKNRGKYISVKESKGEEDIKLTQEEQELLQRLINGDQRLIMELYDEYREVPVSAREFFSSEYYIGSAARTLRDKLKEDLVEIFSGNYNEVIYGGAIRYGKTFIASLIMMRLLYELLCMKDPHKGFGIDRSQGLYFVNISITEELALNTIYESFVGKINDSPYFLQYKIAERKSDIEFYNGIYVIGGESSDTGILGKNIVCAVMDEANFYSKDNKSKTIGTYKDKAESIYKALIRRVQLFNIGKQKFGKVVLLSSKRDIDDFVERRIRDVQQTGDSNVFVREYAFYDVVPYQDKRFAVFIGDINRAPCMLKDEEVANYDEEYIEYVPEVFRSAFETDLIGSLRDIAGVGISSDKAFISRFDKLDKAFINNREVIWQSELVVGKDQLDLDKLVNRTQYGYEPKVFPRNIRYCGIDFGLKKDRTGFVMGTIADYKLIESVNSDGTTFIARLPVIYIDLMLGIRSSLGELEFAWVRELIYNLLRYGYKIRFVACDSFQSYDTLQILAKQGILSKVVSVDRTIMPYEILKNCIYDERLIGYNYTLVINELKHLQVIESRNKVDHLPTMSKDVADALAMCVYALTDEELAPKDVVDRAIVTSYEEYRREGIQTPPHIFPGEEEEVEAERGANFDIPILRG